MAFLSSSGTIPDDSLISEADTFISSTLIPSNFSEKSDIALSFSSLTRLMISLTIPSRSSLSISGLRHRSSHSVFPDKVLFSLQYHFLDWYNKNAFCACFFELVYSFPELVFLHYRVEAAPAFLNKRNYGRAFHSGKNVAYLLNS